MALGGDFWVLYATLCYKGEVAQQCPFFQLYHVFHLVESPETKSGSLASQGFECNPYPAPTLMTVAYPDLSPECLPRVLNCREDFPGGAVVKNLPAKTGDTGLIPGPGRSHMPWSN